MLKTFTLVACTIVVVSGCAVTQPAEITREDEAARAYGNHDSRSAKPKVKTNGATLNSEAFGDSRNPPILLIMGAMTSGTWWPDDFCRQLAQKGRFVIRYDHRDTGESTSYDPGKPGYSTEDLADDAVAVLDAYNVKTAHVVGMSLGGYLSQLIALKYPGKVLTLTLIASERLDLADPSLPGTSPSIIAYHKKANQLDRTNKKEFIDYQVGAWRLLTGSGRKFDAQAVEETASADFDRTPNPLSAFNHALLGDAFRWVGHLDEITAPTLIIHGTEDPVLPFAHAKALKAAIAHSTLIPLKGAGHELNREDWNTIIEAIDKHTKKK